MSDARGFRKLTRLVAAPMRGLIGLFRRRPDYPSDPYAGVRAPKKPVLPRRSAAIALEEPD